MKRHDSDPQVSVIVPNYNHASFLSERLQSILAQTYQNFELIVLDDASTDNSLEVILRCLGAIPYRLFVNEINSGSTFLQWALGISHATGKIIWLAESDDVADPLLLETLVRSFEDQSVGLSYAQSKIIDEASRVTGSAKRWSDELSQTLWSSDFKLDGRFLLAPFFLIKNIIPNASAVLFRKELFVDIAKLYPELRLVGDWILWSKIASVSSICFSARSLNSFRVHEASVRSNQSIEVQLEYVKAAEHVANLCYAGRIHAELYHSRDRLLRIWNQLGVFDLPHGSEARQIAFKFIRTLYGPRALIPMFYFFSRWTLFVLKRLVR